MKPYKISDLSNRLPQAGRIRLGRKVVARNGKQAPGKLRTFRFTSSDAASLDRVADLYGGEPRRWEDKSSPDKFELLTEASEVQVALPPDPLGGTPIFELWEGGGCKRRCDGDLCVVPRGGGRDGEDPLEVPCICDREGLLACRVTTRLSVILPNVRFLGTWRVDSKGRNAAEELPGMVAGVQALQAQGGIVPAVLRLEERITWNEGRKQEYVVPVIGVDATPVEMAAGAVRLGSGDNGVVGALGPAEVVIGERGSIPLPETPDLVLPADPTLVRAWGESLTNHQRSKVLTRCVELAAERGRRVPLSFDELTVEQVDEAMGEFLWNQQREVTDV